MARNSSNVAEKAKELRQEKELGAVLDVCDHYIQLYEAELSYWIESKKTWQDKLQLKGVSYAHLRL